MPIWPDEPVIRTSSRPSLSVRRAQGYSPAAGPGRRLHRRRVRSGMPSTRSRRHRRLRITRKGGSRHRVRAIHRTGQAGRRPRPGRGTRSQAQLHRDGAHPARAPARGGGPRRARARAARHHRGRGARPGRPHRRPGRRGHDRPDPVHAAREEGLELALREALSLGHNYIGTEHILLGLVRENEGVAARILLDFDADAEKIRNEIIRMLSGPGRRQSGQPGGARAGREGEELEAPRPVRPQPDEAGDGGQARPRGRPPDRDRARDADPLAPPEEQPGADRRAGRRQDRRRRGPRRAHRREPGARASEEQADLHARPRRARGGLEVPRGVRGAPEEGDEGDHPARRHHPVHRRAPQSRRGGRRRGRDRRSLDPQAGARPRRAADDRRDDARRVPQVPRARRRARAALPAGARRGADDRRDRADPPRPPRPLRGAPPREDHRRGARRPPRCSPTATSRTATSPTRRST